MPPFTTLNGQTGYYMNGQFVPATQQEYNTKFSQTNQTQNQFNPFLPPSSTAMMGRQDFVQQGTIQGPEAAGMTNEQKVMQSQGDDTTMSGVGNMPYVKMGNEYGVQKGKSFFPFDAMTASGHPLNTATNTVFNAYDLMANKKGKIANPYEAQVALIQSQNTQNALNAFINPAAPTQTQVASPISTAPEITPTPTANQSGGGNWVTNMFNRPSVTGVPNTTEVATNVAEGTGDVLGDWGKMGFSGKEFFGSDAGKTTSAIAGAGVGLVSGLVKAGAPDKYDQRVGMSKPNLGGNLFGDATFTQVGLNPALMAATGGISALVGGGVDLVKNVVKYAKQKDRYENKKLATDTMQSIDDARENMKPDYTGYARFGTQVKNPYLKKYKNGGEGDPEDPDFITPFLTGLASNVQKGLSYGIEQGKNAINYFGNAAEGLQKYQQLPDAKEKKSLPYIDMFKGLNNVKNPNYFIDKNILNSDIFKNDMFENVAIDNTYTGINPNMRKVSNAPYIPTPNEAKLNTTARDYLGEIYTSPGYKEKLEKELKKSGITNKTADDVIAERLYRVQNTPMKNLSKSDPMYESAYGYMHPMTSGPFITSPGIRMRTDRVNNEPLNYFSTAIEELEHASHVKRIMLPNMFNEESFQNITPEAKRIFDLHAPATSKESTQFDNDRSFLERSLNKPYLKQYTENMAKKRAAEAYLINAGKLKPGENVSEDHYEFLLDNYLFLPNNVKSALDMTNENKNWSELDAGGDKEFLDEAEKRYNNALKYYKSKENPTKDDLKYYYKNQLRKEELLKTKEKYKKSQENFLKIMNEIAVNNQDNNNVFTVKFGTQATNPYLNESLS